MDITIICNLYIIYIYIIYKFYQKVDENRGGDRRALGLKPKHAAAR